VTPGEIAQYKARIAAKPDSVAMFDADEVAQLLTYTEQLQAALALGRDCYRSMRYIDQGDLEPMAFATALRELGFLPSLDSRPNDQ